MEFTISYLQFSCLARISAYVAQRGNEKTSLTIDRKDNRKGYVPGNLKVMTRERNVEKELKYDMHRMRAGYAWRHNHG